jgi:hypothetical protein
LALCSIVQRENPQRFVPGGVPHESLFEWNLENSKIRRSRLGKKTREVFFKADDMKTGDFPPTSSSILCVRASSCGGWEESDEDSSAAVAELPPSGAASVGSSSISSPENPKLNG